MADDTANETGERALLQATEKAEPNETSLTTGIAVRVQTEEMLYKRTRSVVQIEAPLTPISLEQLTDPNIARTILDERDYWRALNDEKGEAIQTLTARNSGLSKTAADLDKRCALLSQEVDHGHRSSILESAMLALGGVVFGAGISAKPVDSAFIALGSLLFLMGFGSMIVARIRSANRQGKPETHK